MPIDQYSSSLGIVSFLTQLREMGAYRRILVKIQAKNRGIISGLSHGMQDLAECNRQEVLEGWVAES
jgi:hypothetical protein